MSTKRNKNKIKAQGALLLKDFERSPLLLLLYNFFVSNVDLNVFMDKLLNPKNSIEN